MTHAASLHRRSLYRKLPPSLPAVLAVLALLLPVTAAAAGFSVFEQGSKAMGMAGAFTAQADDPSALFHNVGGLAFFDERQIAAGFTLVTSTDETFVGRGPGLGSGATGSLESLREPVPHVYWVEPINDTWSFGLSLNAPFGLKTEWENPDTFAGRFINTEASLFVADVSPNVGVRLTDDFGIGFGAIVRFSEVELNRRQGVFLTPLNRLVDVASIRLESDLNEGYGWQVGALHKVTDRFSWGFSYRSKIEVDYDGDARFTQIATISPALDAQIAASLPFDQDLPVKTKIEFPDSASLGLAYVVVPQVLMELDVNWTGWSSFDTLPIEFTTVPSLSFERPENWDDVYSYRFGVRWDAGTDSQWRFGFVYDESPQPTESVSPLLPDSNRNGYTVGWGHHGSRFDVDLALMYLDFDARTNDRSIDQFNGTYSQTGWLFGATLGF